MWQPDVWSGTELLLQQVWSLAEPPGCLSTPEYLLLNSRVLVSASCQQHTQLPRVIVTPPGTGSLDFLDLLHQEICVQEASKEAGHSPAQAGGMVGGGLGVGGMVGGRVGFTAAGNTQQ